MLIGGFMNFLQSFTHGYSEFLHMFAEFVVNTLELIGILIIVFGSIGSLAKLLVVALRKKPTTIIIDLGKTLAFALEFKMGAEIINTVIVRDLRELGILAIVIVIRALLAILIHWEIKMEKDEKKMLDNK